MRHNQIYLHSSLVCLLGYNVTAHSLPCHEENIFKTFPQHKHLILSVHQPYINQSNKMTHCTVRSIYYTNFQSRLINYNIFVVERFGFRRRLSTANGTGRVAGIVLNVWNNNRYTGCVYCDQTEVFVCANHELSVKQTTTLCSQRQTLRLV